MKRIFFLAALLLGILTMPVFAQAATPEGKILVKVAPKEGKILKINLANLQKEKTVVQLKDLKGRLISPRSSGTTMVLCAEIGAGGEGHAAHPLLVAIDLDTSQGGALHGVLGSELSRSLQAVARRARNLRVILDCCHASAMVRLDDDLEDPDIYAQERDLQIEASARISKRRGPVCRGGHVGPRERLSERVVVLAASSAGGRMYPHPVTKRLVFTDALIAALAQFTTWDEVLADVRAEVQAVWPTQHPAVFGPRFRQPFALVEHLPEGVQHLRWVARN